VNADKSNTATWTILTIVLSILLAANSFSNYQSLSLATTSRPAAPEPRPHLSAVVWTGDTPAPTHRAPARDLRELRRGLLINTSLALVLVFAVAAPFNRRRP
jgi:hypothetical protein